jgi:hypothetical protein
LKHLEQISGSKQFVAIQTRENLEFVDATGDYILFFRNSQLMTTPKNKNIIKVSSLPFDKRQNKATDFIMHRVTRSSSLGQERYVGADPHYQVRIVDELVAKLQDKQTPM